MNYILQNANIPDRYIIADHSKPVEVTNNKGRATVFENYNQAANFIKNQLPKRIRGTWVVTEYDIKTERLHFDLPNQDPEGFNWSEIIDSVQNCFIKLFAYRDELQRELNAVGAELCDCIHACEFFKLDAAKGYKIYKMIRDRRVRRRFLKNELNKIAAVLEASNSDLINGVIQKKFEAIETQSYEPRVLKELFDDEVDKEETQ